MKSNSRMIIKTVSSGSGATQYAIISLLIVVVCLAGIVFFGKKDEADVKLQTDKSGLAITALDDKAQDKAHSTSLRQALTSLQTETVAYPNQVVKTIRVYGVNGATQKLLASLEGRIRAFKANGDITEAQESILRHMVNRGHDLAISQKMLEEALVQGRPKVLYNGADYEVREFIRMRGFDYAASPAEIWALKPESTSSPVLRPFAEAYRQVQNSPMFLNPDIRQQISELVLQISAVDDSLTWAVDEIINKSDSGLQSRSNWMIRSKAIRKFEFNVKNAPISEPFVPVEEASEQPDGNF
jgi:hypothetical protein